jgi:L,D-transpeptidase catalytic domain
VPVALPPWIDLDEVPLAAWAQAVAPKKGDMIIVDEPSAAGHRRGVSQAGATLPLFGAKRGPGCGGRWLLVGPLAWVCSDTAALSSDEPRAAGYPSGSDGLPYSYYFTGRDGAAAYAKLEFADEAAPDRELEGGWSVAITAQRSMNGELWGETPHGLWVQMRELGAAHPSTFHGELVSAGALDFAWVVSDHANVFAGPSIGKVSGSRVRFERVAWHETKEMPGGAMVRISDDGAPAPEWMLVHDLAHPEISTPPDEVGGAATHERWVDVHLANETLVAYDGTTPVFATLVSTGRGPQGSESATPVGVHRVWVKLAASTMDNAERDDVGKHYSMEDVPWVQFFDKAVALHGVYWHSQFGRVKSHGCVNLAPLDARWLFGWTSPRLPAGWAAAFPTDLEKGSAVRIR